MRIHYLIHAEFEKLGAIAQWINNNNYSATASHTYRGDPLPATSQFDMLIIMGGPQSVCRLEDYAYLRDEIALVKKAINENKVILGICLGAQIIGEALGAKTEKSPHQEIGIYPVEITPEAKDDPIFQQFSPQFDVMHWHSDMPGVPDDAVLLAKSAGCPRQAFRYGDRIYGLQFHLELTPELIKEMLKHEEIKPTTYVQSKDELLRADLHAINQKIYPVLDFLAAKVKR
jgi:GMP synthase (glutamine-hydrolysing)